MESTKYCLLKSLIVIITSVFYTFTSVAQNIADAPLFRDPVTDGAADPCVIFNRQENNWCMLYTQRRANCESAGVAYCYGTKIGIASSDDQGRSWTYRGTLDLEFERGENTFWAPAVVYEDGVYHLFVVFIRGIRTSWGGSAQITHYTSSDLWDWQYQGSLEGLEPDIIDPTLFKLPDGTWRMWYKHNSHSYYADSKDLFNWVASGAKAVDGPDHEGTIVFYYKDRYWLVVDEWMGMGVYSSNDCINWMRQDSRILDSPGLRPDDGPSGAHGDVVVCDDEAYIFYFTHPGRKKHTEDTENEIGVVPYEIRRSSLQVARLNVVAGKLVIEDRSHGVPICLKYDNSRFGNAR